MPTLYLIDGSGYIFRAYHALPPLSNAAGEPIGAVYGFMNMLLKLKETAKAEALAVVFDAGRATFRNRLYGGYKANRPELPADLVPQFKLVREATDALAIARVEREDFEADDLIAAYVKAGKEAGMEVVIVSSDKDLMQLVCEGVRMHDPMKNKPIGEAEVMEKFGVPPAKVREVLALIGDTSDNVPGVPGIGPKTAAELIGRFGDLETLLARASEITQEKRRAAIIENIEQARLSYRLVGLRDDVELPLPLSALAAKEPDAGKLGNFLRARGFKALLQRLKLDACEETAQPPVPTEAVAASYSLVQEREALFRWIAEAKAKGMAAVDTETTSLSPERAELVGISLAVAPGKACYIPVGHKAPGLGLEASDKDLFDIPKPQAPSLKPRQLPLAEVIAALKPLMEDAGVLKIGQNIKYDLRVLERHGIHVSPIDDTMMLSYLLSTGKGGHGMDELAERHLHHKTISYDEVTGTGKSRISFAEVALEKALAYAAEDADVTFRLWEKLKPEVAASNLLTLYETVERPLIPVVAAMESRGIAVDVGVLQSLSAEFASRMAALETEIHALAGRVFNVGSPKQLGEVLFDEQQLPGGRKSMKTGAYSTDNYVLEELSALGHAMPARVMEWRQLSKLKGTYADALLAQINPETGRVHTCFSLASTSTGRLSSSDPNLQNIPIRTEDGRKIRRAFIAAPGCKLISADYSQIELRLLAHVANIAPLRQAFRNGEDIHAITASRMFGVGVEAVDPDMRRRAKTINFGIIYGMSAHGLASRLGIGRAEAAAYIEQYFRQYPGIRDYMERAKEEARTHGYVTTLFGRRCHIPGIQDKIAGRRQGAERQAINAPLQGTAADIIKKAMIAVEKALQGLSAAMLLQVHDELVFEVKEGAEEEALARIRRAMEQAADLSVPLVVETGVGNDWGAIH